MPLIYYFSIGFWDCSDSVVFFLRNDVCPLIRTTTEVPCKLVSDCCLMPSH
jgi:hypothetical protein